MLVGVGLTRRPFFTSLFVITITVALVTLPTSPFITTYAESEDTALSKPLEVGVNFLDKVLGVDLTKYSLTYSNVTSFVSEKETEELFGRIVIRLCYMSPEGDEVVISGEVSPAPFLFVTFKGNIHYKEDSVLSLYRDGKIQEATKRLIANYINLVEMGYFDSNMTFLKSLLMELDNAFEHAKLVNIDEESNIERYEYNVSSVFIKFSYSPDKVAIYAAPIPTSTFLTIGYSNKGIISESPLEIVFIDYSGYFKVVRPQETLSKDEAIEIAKQAVMGKYNLTSSDLERMVSKVKCRLEYGVRGYEYGKKVLYPMYIVEIFLKMSIKSIALDRNSTGTT